MKSAFPVFVVILTALAYFIGLIVELIKKYVFSDPDRWEIRVVAFVLSLGGGTLMFLIFDVGEIMGSGIRNTPWLIAVYAVCLYLLQLPACMAFWKPIIKKLIERKMQ